MCVGLGKREEAVKTSLGLRVWAGPLTIGSFGVVAITGILMFFHLNIGLVKFAHEWLGWLLVVGAVAHVILNWKPFLAYFRKPSGIAITVTLFLLGVLSFLPSGGGRGRPPFGEAFRALERSSLSVLAPIAKSSPQSLVDQLKARGIRVQDSEQTITEVASQNSMPSMVILGYILAPGGRLDSGAAPDLH
jgi:hypothetical protein